VHSWPSAFHSCQTANPLGTLYANDATYIISTQTYLSQQTSCNSSSANWLQPSTVQHMSDVNMSPPGAVASVYAEICSVPIVLTDHLPGHKSGVPRNLRGAEGCARICYFGTATVLLHKRAPFLALKASAHTHSATSTSRSSRSSQASAFGPA
jgi:hypothetical protein